MANKTRVPARRVLVLAALLALTLVLSACGGASKTVQHPGTVRVNFCTTLSMPDCKSDATRAQEQTVGRMLRRIPNVTKVAFVSKSAGLQRFTKINPALVRGLHGLANPLPDEWVVTVSLDRYDAKVGRAICAAHLPGVQPCARGGQRGAAGGVTWGSPITDRIRRLYG